MGLKVTQDTLAILLVFAEPVCFFFQPLHGVMLSLDIFTYPGCTMFCVLQLKSWGGAWE